MELLSKVAKDGSAVQQFAQRNAAFKQKEVGVHNESRVHVTSDSLMSVRSITDRNGNVMQQDFAFKPTVINHLVNKDGTINSNMLEQIKAGTNFDKKTLDTAIALEIMKRRGIGISSGFASRDVTIDKNGSLRFVQTNADGSTIELNTTFGGANGNQMLSEFKQTASDGSYTAIVDNGIMKATTTYKDGDKDATLSYEFADEYYRRHKYMKPLNGDGTFAAGMDKDAAMFGFSEADLALHSEQVRTGKAHSVSSSYTSAFQHSS